jgi:hypothetical protein
MSNLYFRTVRRWTASLRALPDYVIIGAQKGILLKRVTTRVA